MDPHGPAIFVGDEPGLAAADDVQRVLHDVTGSVQPKGWSHQISDGGEPTAATG